jgi:hypothetical protein
MKSILLLMIAATVPVACTTDELGMKNDGVIPG